MKMWELIGQRGERMASFLSKVIALKIASFVDKNGSELEMQWEQL